MLAAGGRKSRDRARPRARELLPLRS